MKKLIIGLVVVLSLALVAPGMAEVVCPDGKAATTFKFEVNGTASMLLCGSWLFPVENVRVDLKVSPGTSAPTNVCTTRYTNAAGKYCVNCQKTCSAAYVGEPWSFQVVLDYTHAVQPTPQKCTSPIFTEFPFCCCDCCYQKFKRTFNCTVPICS